MPEQVTGRQLIDMGEAAWYLEVTWRNRSYLIGPSPDPRHYVVQEPYQDIATYTGKGFSPGPVYVAETYTLVSRVPVDPVEYLRRHNASEVLVIPESRMLATLVGLPAGAGRAFKADGYYRDGVRHNNPDWWAVDVPRLATWRRPGPAQCPVCAREGFVPFPHATPDGTLRCPVPMFRTGWFQVSECRRCETKHGGTTCPECADRRPRMARGETRQDDFRFGVELETGGIDRDAQAGDLCTRLPLRPGGAWRAKHDGSIGHVKNAEVITPPLRYTEANLKALQDGTRLLRRAGARALPTCGLHVHVDATDLTPAQVVSAVEWWYAAQAVVVNSALCIRPDRLNRYTRQLDLACLQRVECHDFGYDRYRTLNTTNYAPGRTQKCTLEFRVFDGTLHAGFVRAAVSFCVGLVANATATANLRGPRNRPTPYPQNRAGMDAVLDFAGVYRDADRWHLLGRLRTEEDRPKPGPTRPERDWSGHQTVKTAMVLPKQVPGVPAEVY